MPPFSWVACSVTRSHEPRDGCGRLSSSRFPLHDAVARHPERHLVPPGTRQFAGPESARSPAALPGRAQTRDSNRLFEALMGVAIGFAAFLGLPRILFGIAAGDLLSRPHSCLAGPTAGSHLN